MPRPREFDPESALESAMQVFWNKGFEATSLADLTEAMGISRSSLYDTFGSKQDLYLAALDHYNASVTQETVDTARAEGDARARIASIFADVIDRLTTDGDRRGCFLGNCVTEGAGFDAGAEAKVQGGFGMVEDALAELVARGKQDGSVTTAKETRAVARFLFASFHGLFVIGKANADPQMLREIADTALTVLE